MVENCETPNPSSVQTDAEQITRDIRAPRFSINDASKPVPLHVLGLIRRRWALALASLVLAGAGFIFSVVIISLERAGAYLMDIETFRSLKFVGIIITLFLVGCIVAYHIFDSQLQLLLYSFIGQRGPPVTWRRLIGVAAEILICCAVPLPLLKVSEETDSTVDAILAPLMVCRLYLIPRALQVLSLGQTPRFPKSSDPNDFPLSIHEMNDNLRAKALFLRFPLAGFCLLYVVSILTMSWAIFLAEQASPYGGIRFCNALYLTTITITRIGYGDLIPQTVFGKMCSCFCGVLGVIFTALLVWVVAQKLRLTHKESHALKEIKPRHSVFRNQDNAAVELQNLQRKCDAIIVTLQQNQQMTRTCEP